MDNLVSTSKCEDDDNTQSLSTIPDGKLFNGIGEELQPVEGVDYLDVRKKLIDKFRKKSGSLLTRISTNPGSNSVDNIIAAVLEELVQETENLLGNEIMLMTAGQVEKASVISVKRSDVLDTLSKVAVRKKEVLDQTQDVDLNSPVFQLFQVLCFEKLAIVLEELSFKQEVRQLVVTKWGDKMKNWDREIMDRMKEANG